MDSFEVYRVYMSLKLHFTSDDYDITKTKSGVKCKKETFLKRKDVLLFRKLAKRYSFTEMVDYFVANFVNGHNGVFDAESDNVYRDWKARKEKLTYLFTQDIATLIFEAEKANVDPLVSDGQHPLALKLYLGKKISLETLVILDKLFDFVYINKAMLENDFIWKDVSRLITKYRVFVKFDKDKFTQLWYKEKGQVVF